jgi:hypothetical protein
MSENNAVLEFQAETSKTADGSTPALDMRRYNSAVFSIRVTNMAGGSPTITPKLMHSMDNVNFVELYSFGSKSATGHCVLAIPNDTQFGFMGYVRWDWVLGGTTPNVTFECGGTGKE